MICAIDVPSPARAASKRMRMRKRKHKRPWSLCPPRAATGETCACVDTRTPAEKLAAARKRRGLLTMLGAAAGLGARYGYTG